MKKHINPYRLAAIAAILLIPFLSSASGGSDVDKKKTISKSYTVGSDEKLSIENSFGNVVVSTWDKNEISVDIVIGVNAATEEKAQKMLDEITVSDRKSGNEISFKTGIGNMGHGKKNRDGDQRRFYVDYKITMPSDNPLSIENSFGKINIGNFTGPVSLTSKFGELTTGRLSNARFLHVEFGKAEIGPVDNPDITLKFNSKSLIKSISGNAKIHTEFCSNVEFTIDPGINDLYLFESYSTLRLNVPENLSARFHIHTNFGSFVNNSGISIPEVNEDDNAGPKFDKDFSGSSGKGDAQIRIKSSFGKISLFHAGDASDDPDAGANDNRSGNENNKNEDSGTIKL